MVRYNTVRTVFYRLVPTPGQLCTACEVYRRPRLRQKSSAFSILTIAVSPERVPILPYYKSASSTERLHSKVSIPTRKEGKAEDEAEEPSPPSIVGVFQGPKLYPLLRPRRPATLMANSGLRAGPWAISRPPHLRTDVSPALNTWRRDNFSHRRPPASAESIHFKHRTPSVSHRRAGAGRTADV